MSAHLAAGRERDAARTTGDVGRALNRLRRPQEAVERLGAALATLAGDQLDPDVAQPGRYRQFVGGEVGTDHERAGPRVQTALQIAEALDLPAVLCDALNLEAMVSMFTGRVRQARVLCAGALEIAQSHELTRQLAIAQGNMGNLGMLWDLPDAEEHIQRAVALARRRGDRRLESLNSGNLMIVVARGSLVAGRELAGELLADDEQRPGAEHLHCRLAILHALRGDPGAAQASLERLPAWEITDEREARANHAATRIGVLLAQGASAMRSRLASGCFPTRSRRSAPPTSPCVRHGPMRCRPRSRSDACATPRRCSHCSHNGRSVTSRRTCALNSPATARLSTRPRIAMTRSKPT